MSIQIVRPNKPSQHRLLVFSIIVVLFSYGCRRDIHDHPSLTTGQQLFEFHCLECHREKGQGSFLRGVPPNNDTQLSAFQISHKIRKANGKESKMPLFPTMSKQEAIKISYYLKQIGRVKHE